MPRVTLYLILLFLFKTSSGQVQFSGIILTEKDQPLSSVSITLHKNYQPAILAFAISDQAGRFTITYSSTVPDSMELGVSLLGYAQQTIRFLSKTQEFFKVILYRQSITLPEVKVKPAPVWQRKDTINYLVSEFTQAQDRVIGDIIARLPGMEVTAGGQIKYNGKPINKYYIEGLDLLEDRYGIANNNIPAQIVEKVQVLENHQPIRVLDSIAFSDRAALNIQLKNTSRLKPVSRAQPGVGFTPLLTEDQLATMLFRKNVQLINIYKYNNTGQQNAAELSFKNADDYINALQAGATKKDMMTVVQPPSPSINADRYLFNSEHVLSLNQLFPLKRDWQLRANADYVNDVNKQESETLTTIYLPDDTISIREKYDYRKKISRLQAGFSILANTPNFYMKNMLKFEQWGSREKSDLLSAMLVQQNLHNPSWNLSDEFSLVRSRHGHVTEWSSYSAIVGAPQELQVKPGLYQSFLNNNQTYDLLSQEIFLRSFYTNNYFSLRSKIRGVFFEYKAGLSIELKRLFSALSIESADARKLLPETFQNHLNWKRYQLYNEANWSWQNRYTRLSFQLPFSFHFIQYRDSLSGIRTEMGKFFVNPSLTAIVTLSPLWNLDASMSYISSMGGVEDVAKGYILKTYRSLLSGNEQPALNQSLYSFLTINYRNPLKVIFLSTGIVFNRTRSNLLSSRNYDNILELITSLKHVNYNSSATINTRFSKYIISWKTSFTIQGSYTFGYLEQIQQVLPVRMNNQNRNAGLTINARINSKLSTDYINSYSRFIFKSAGNGQKASFEKFNQSVSLNYYPSVKMIMGFTGEQYFFSNQLSPARNYYFADLWFRYKPTASRIDYEFSCQNVFNSRSFVTVVLDNNIASVSEFRLRPRQFLFKMSFSF